MEDGHLDRIGEAEARAVWRRAAALQAARREPRPAPGGSLPARLAGDHTVAEVVEAAVAAGIDRGSVLLALAERRLPDAAELEESRPLARAHRLLLGPHDALEVSAAVAAPPRATLAAFERVVERPEFRLMLEDRVGPGPPPDGVDVYRSISPPFGASVLHGAFATADVRAVLLALLPAEGGTQIVLRAPLYEHGTNLVVGGGFGVGAGAGGAAAGGALAGVVALPLAALAAPAAVAGAALGVAGFRGIQRWGRRQGETALRRLLRAVEMEVARSD